MSRPKEFDVDQVLQSALEVFWLKGYEATSMQDLVAAMGIQKASLYGTFGDKHSLYLAALQRYQAAALAAMTVALAQAPSPLAAIKQLLANAADGASARQGKRGCFCVNANVEMAPHDEAITAVVRTHSEQVEALLEKTLLAARKLGELPKRTNCKRLASFLYGVVVAINVMGKQRAGDARLQAMVEGGLAALAS